MSYLGEKIGKKVARAGELEQAGHYSPAAALWNEAATLMQAFAIDALSESSKARRIEKVREYSARARSLEKGKGEKDKTVQTKGKEPGRERKKSVLVDDNPYRKIVRGWIFRSNVQWENIGGLKGVREELENYFGIFLAQKPAGVAIDCYRNNMLYGPPGTGKTMIAAATSNQLDAVFFNVKASDLTSKYFGESSKLVNALYEEARYQADTGLSIVFIDEFDSLCRSRDKDTSGAEQRILSTILSELDGLAEKGEDRGVLTIAATNRPDNLDNAVRSRFQKQFYIPLPDSAARQDILKKCLDSSGLKTTCSLVEIAGKTDGFSGRDLQGVLRGAQAQMIARHNEGLTALVRQGKEAIENYILKVGPLLEEDFVREIAKIKVDPDAARKSREFYGRYQG